MTRLDNFTSPAIELLKRDRLLMLENYEMFLSNRLFVKAIKDVKLASIVTPLGRQSLTFFNLRTSGKTKLGSLNENEINSLDRFVKNKNFMASAK